MKALSPGGRVKYKIKQLTIETSRVLSVNKRKIAK